MSIWSEDEVNKLLALSAQGMTRAAIGKVMGRSARSVHWKARELIASGKLSTATVTPWTEERLQHVANLWTDGRSSGQIAKETGFTRNSVMSAVSRMGLLRHGRKPSPKGQRGRHKNFDLNQSIRRRFLAGSTPYDIANILKMRKDAIAEKLTAMGLDPNANTKTAHYHVHPMWSMNEDDRRQAFYEKFTEGWKDVLKRLAS